jgi:hypothetical protein
MNKISEIAARITELEQQLEEALTEELKGKRREVLYVIERGRVAFTAEARVLHQTLRQGAWAFLWEAPVKTLLVAPVIYSVLIPLVLLDLWMSLYQAVCFPIYGIGKVLRARYILLDRGQLRYLNWIERLNCNYCGYANGVVAYTREIAARTEQYFCPIKHAQHCAGLHSRYRDFLEFGDAETYKRELARLRANLRS